MVSQGMFSIGGIASGLDTAGIVDQLLQLERRPMVAIQQRQAAHQRADQAWGQIVTRLSTLRTATDRLDDPDWLQKTTAATSSNESVARVSASGGATPGSLSFDVDQLATSHQVALGGIYTSADAVMGAGEITLTRGDGQERSVTLGDGATLADAARALNGLDGVSARVLRVADGQHRLIVGAEETGEAAGFAAASTVAGIDDTQSQTLSVGQDAILSLGDLTVTRSSNTISDLVDGVSVELAGTGAVTIDVQQDQDQAATQVKAFVDGLNGLLNQISTASRSSAEAGERGPLAGDPLARDLATKLRGALSEVRGEGTFATLSQIGISLTRTGSVTLDEGKLRSALGTDPEAVASLLGKASAADDARVEVAATGRAQPGRYQVQIDTAASVASLTGDPYVAPADASTFTIALVAGASTDVTLEPGDDLETAVERINASLLGAGVTGITATAADGRIQIASDRAGAGNDFTITGAAGLGLDGTATGVSAAGTIGDGTETWALSGSGRSLSVTDGPARGMVVRIPAGVDGDLGSITIGDGLGSIMDRVLRTAEGSGGSIARARDAVQGRIDSGNDSLERFEQRLEIRERSIRRQFTALESAMARFNAQGNWLGQQIGSMNQ